MPRERAIGGICDAGCRFATHGKFLFKDSDVLGLIGIENDISATEIRRTSVWGELENAPWGRNAENLSPMSMSMYFCVAQNA